MSWHLNDQTNNLTITRAQYKPIPDFLSFSEIKKAILGKKYELEITFADTKTASQLHKEHKKTYEPGTTLAFPYSETSGEIVGHLGAIRAEAKKFNHTYQEHLLFMIIHAMLHLKGYDHGKEMEEQEDKFFKKFRKTLTL